MRLSLSITEYPHDDIRGHLARIVRAADEGGLDTVWVADHLLQAAPGASHDDPMLEAYTTLGYLAGRSERVRLGAMVSPVTYRAPALLRKAVETLNELSGGRAWLGVGAGYHEEEAQLFGLDLPPMRERFERLERFLETAGIRPDPDRRHRRAPHAAAGRTVCGRLQRLRHPRRRRDDPSQARRPQAPLRGARPPVRGDREDGLHAPEARRGRRRVLRPLYRAARARARPRRRDRLRPVVAGAGRRAQRDNLMLSRPSWPLTSTPRRAITR